MDNTNQIPHQEPINNLSLQPPAKSKKRMITVIVIILLLVATGVAIWFAFDKKDKQTALVQQTDQPSTPSCNIDKLTLTAPTEEEIKENPFAKLKQDPTLRKELEDAHNNNPAFKFAGQLCQSMKTKGYEIFAQHNGAADGLDNTNAYYKYFFKKTGELNDIKKEIAEILESKDYSSVNISEQKCMIKEQYKNDVINLKTKADIDAYAKKIGKFDQHFYTNKCDLYHAGTPYWVIAAKTTENDNVTVTISDMTFSPFEIATSGEISNDTWLEKAITDGKTVVVIQWSYHANPVF